MATCVCVNDVSINNQGLSQDDYETLRHYMLCISKYARKASKLIFPRVARSEKWLCFKIDDIESKARRVVNECDSKI